MHLLTAKPVIEKRFAALQARVIALTETLGRAPHLSVVLMGNDPASQVYVKKKAVQAEKAGFTSETILFSADVSSAEVFHCVQELNQSDRVDGILIQRPLPKSFTEKDVVLWVSPEKDVDCLHPENIGLLVSGHLRFAPCTPAGIMNLLDFYKITVSGKTACVVGRSAIVGKPLAALLLNQNATVIQVHRSTPNPQALCRLADLVFAAAGSRHLIDETWLKTGATVIDVGIHRDEHGKISGDVDAFSAGKVASALTPVPGGVGPMTIQTLLENTALAAELRT